MKTYLRHATVALVFVAAAGTASAQTLIVREPDQTVIARPPLQLTPTQRTTIYRTIMPQGRGRAPIIKERIVLEPVPTPAPVVRERVIQPVEVDGYLPTPGVPRRIVAQPDGYQDYALAVGERVPATTRLAPLPPAVVAEVPATRPYRYIVINNRLLLIDPATSTVIADLSD
jgi:hypothetical protein